jgi:hypothetical protein
VRFVPPIEASIGLSLRRLLKPASDLQATRLDRNSLNYSASPASAADHRPVLSSDRCDRPKLHIFQ